MESGTSGTEPVDFDREIRPILSEHCYPCHGPDSQARKADLRLDRREDAFRVRDGFAVIVPAKVEESELIRRVASAEPEEVMPPPKFKKRLDSRQIDRLRQWVRRGGEMGRPLVPIRCPRESRRRR